MRSFRKDLFMALLPTLASFAVGLGLLVRIGFLMEDNSALMAEMDLMEITHKLRNLHCAGD